MNIILADDDKIVQMSLKTIIEAEGDIKVLATANDGEEAITLYNQHQPDVALFDIQMPNASGIDAAKAILSQNPAAKILFLTTFEDDEYIGKAIAIGAKGYILKHNFETIAQSLRTVASGQAVFGTEIIQRIKPQSAAPDFSKWDLTEKETELIKYVGEGLNNKEIARAMFLTEGTVRNYLSSVLEKLNLRDRTQLAVFYYKGGV
ncbi:MAG: response regulator transcription factor [Defluviitaleaceae bacterium]|nr:response regulator transcription factor [Defluviitaleaceae bacterium]